MAQYDAVADRYAQLIAPRYQPIAQLVADHARPAATARVVEFSAGTGALTRLLAPRVVAEGSYLALDNSAPMLSHARPTVDRRVEFLVADVEAVPLPDRAADLVVSSLGPVQDTARGLGEAFRLLRPGGRLVLGMWGTDYAERALLAAARNKLDLPPYPATSVADATARVLRSGFSAVRSASFRLPVVHESVVAYQEYRASFGRPPSLPLARLPAALDAIGDAALAYTDARGRVCLDWTVVVLEATRPAGHAV